jgi:hypothetical protein
VDAKNVRFISIFLKFHAVCLFWRKSSLKFCFPNCVIKWELTSQIKKPTKALYFYKYSLMSLHMFQLYQAIVSHRALSYDIVVSEICVNHTKIFFKWFSFRFLHARTRAHTLARTHTHTLTRVTNFMNLNVQDFSLLLSITHFKTIVWTLCAWFRWIGMRSHGWKVGFPRSPTVAQVTLSSVKVCLPLSEVGCFRGP